MTTEPEAGMDPGGPAAPGEAEELWLAELLDRFVAAIAEGRELEVERARRERPELAAEIEKTARIAESIAPRRPARRPRVAGYEIAGELGHGGMGSVYVAEHARLGRRVALKVLPGRFAGDSRSRERFLREARAIARLDHAHIVQVFDVGEDEGTPYYTMELVEGATLAKVVERLRASGTPPARLGPAELARAAGCERELDASYARSVARVGLDVARALEHAHGRGVVHRDVKPSNVMLRRDGRAQLFDFGLASVEAEQSLTQSGMFLGTPHYASPEQASGHGSLDPRSDLYSLGATLYELATLAPPFRAATTAELLRRVQHEEPPRPRAWNGALPRDLETIVSTAMAKEPARRYLSAAALAADLEAFLAGRPIAARPVGPLTRAALRVRRNPVPSALLAIGIAAPTILFLQQRAANADIRAARDQAQESLALAEAHNEFLGDILASPAPGQAGRDVRVADVLERAESALLERFASRPAVRASLARTLAKTYEALGLKESALRAVELEVAAISERYGPGAKETLAVLTERSRLRAHWGPADALEEIQAALAAAGSSLPPTDHAVQAAEQSRISALYDLRRYAEVLATCEQALASLDQAHEDDPEHRLTLRHLRNLALAALDRPAEALADQEAVHLESLELSGPESMRTLERAEGHAQILVQAGRIDEGLTLFESVGATLEEVLGTSDTRYMAHLHLFAEVLGRMGDLELADRVQSEALELAEQHLAGHDFVSVRIRRKAAGIAHLRGDLERAEEILRRGLELLRSSPGEHSTLREIAGDLALLLERTGRIEEAAQVRASAGL